MLYRSRTYLDGSRGAPCTLRIPGVCRGDAETTVAAHIRDRHTGGGIKASDLSVCDACAECHAVFDRQRRLPGGLLLSNEEWTFYALRALQATLERRHDIGLIKLPGDGQVPTERAVKPRKTVGQRKKIVSRGFDKQHRPLRSRKPNRYLEDEGVKG